MKIIKSFLFAWNGLKICVTSETNFKIHMVFAIAAVFSGVAFAITPAEWLAVISCIIVVTVMEMLNTAVEKLCDMVQKEIHPSIKAIKDIAAGAVLFAAIGSCCIGGIIFIPKIIVFIKSF
jgi:undecaprenol kinase